MLKKEVGALGEPLFILPFCLRQSVLNMGLKGGSGI